MDRHINRISFLYESATKNNTIDINAQLLIKPGMMNPENAAALPALKKLINSPGLICIFLRKK